MVLFITGYASNTMQGQHTPLPPATELINKPFSLVMLADKVKSMIARRHAVADMEPTPP